MSSESVRKGASNLHRWLDQTLLGGLPDDPCHPLRIALRAYALSLSLSLGPCLIPYLRRSTSEPLKAVLKRELGINGFAFSMTLAVGGGAAVQHFWRIVEEANSHDGWWAASRASMPPALASAASVGTIPRQKNSHKHTFERIRTWIRTLNLSPLQKTFLSNFISTSIAITLLQGGHRPRSTSTVDDVPIPLTVPISRTSSKGRMSSVLDLSLLLFVRAADALIQSLLGALVDKQLELKTEDAFGKAPASNHIFREAQGKKSAEEKAENDRQHWVTAIDALVFWFCSARIMWCFFYEPDRLPKSYLRWIAALANIDPKILMTARAIRDNEWSYHTGSLSKSHLLQDYAQQLNLPTSRGDPLILPPFGAKFADSVWKELGVSSRPGVGGVPCEMVHAGVGGNMGLIESCVTNSVVRFVKSFLEAVIVYLPAHFLPVLLTRPRSLFLPLMVKVTLLSTLRSATFLSTFVTSCWFSVCFIRTLVFAKFFPHISHDFWDGPYGGIFAGCLVCGSSIWIENGRRRGEMALYVMPRALRTLLPTEWIKSGGRVSLGERVAFTLSLSWLLSAAIHRPDSLRGLTRWILAFVVKGPNTVFWKQKQLRSSALQTPADSVSQRATPRVSNMNDMSMNF